jgi:hypothetical protein
VLVTAITAYLLQFVLPWWSLAIAAFAACVTVASKAGQALVGSFLGVFMAWAIMAARIDIANHSLLSARVSEIFFVNQSFLLIIITGIIGGLAAMLPGLSGHYLRNLFAKRP